MTHPRVSQTAPVEAQLHESPIEARSTTRLLPAWLFFASGFCGMVYQVVWLRLAMSRFGVITPVLSIVVCVFMLGLALGSSAAGRWIGPLAVRTRFPAIYWYAAAEALIGLGAVSVPRLLSAGEAALLAAGAADSVPYLAASAGIIGLVLLPWCVLMGATVPLMMAFLQSRIPDPGSFSSLYTANVLGALCGVLATAGALIELLGLTRTLLVAAGLNLAIAAVSVWLGVRTSSAGRPTPAVGEQRMDRIPRPLSSRDKQLALLVLFVTGFISMGLEVVWTRAFTPVLRTTVYAFASILAVYLLATWVGSSGYRRDQARGRSLALEHLLAAVAVSVLIPILPVSFVESWQRVGVLLSILPFCVLLGYLTPQLIDRYAAGRPDSAGASYALNLLGCILGPLVASYGLLPRFPTGFIMGLCAVPVLLLSVVAVRAGRSSMTVLAEGLIAVLIGCALSVTADPGDGAGDPFGWRILRDHTATILANPDKKRLFVNGIDTAAQTPITKVMAHLPLASLARPPHSALVICFGTGTTYRSLLSWDIRVTGVELVPSVPRVFGLFHADAPQVLRNPRGRILIDDGRRFLQRTAETFDVITIDPPPPVEAAASSLLYSVEFYELAKRRLSADGIVHQWFPSGEAQTLRAVAGSLREAFPYVVAYRSLEGWGVHFLASRMPIHVPSPADFVARLPADAQRDLVEWSQPPDPSSVVNQILAVPMDINVLCGTPRVLIRDDHPYNEYYLLRRAWAQWAGTFRRVW